MIEAPEITETDARQAAVIPFTIPRDKIREVMGPGIDEIYATLEDQGIEPAGPLFSHHLRMDPDTFDFELGVPVERSVTPTGRVKPGELPAAKVARTVYRGGYEGLPDAWGEFDEWIESSDHTPAGSLWERYVVGPETDADPATWRTELNRPLKG